MRIGIYDPYLDSLGGGERYMLTAASVLARDNSIGLFWNDVDITTKATNRLNINLQNVTVVPDIFKQQSLNKKYFLTKDYDRLFILSDGSIPVTFAKKTFLHFQFPVPWVNGKSFTTQLKLKKITNIICNSVYTKKFIDKTFGVNSIVLYPPCGELQPIPDLKRKKNHILTVGRYNKLGEGESFKKHEFLIKVFKEMIDAGLKNWEMTVIVSHLDDVKKEVEKLVTTAKGYPITFVTQAKHEQVMELYRESKIYWHAAGYNEDLEEHPERAEHFGITTVEAMSAGVVPVVIDAGGQKEIVEHGINGYLWNTKEELIDVTRKLMVKDVLRERIALEAYQNAAQFSTEKFEEHLREIMQ